MVKRYRRGFLQAAASGAVIAAGSGFCGSVRAKEMVSVSGHVVCSNGNPAADVTMEANTNDFPRAVTDANGRFSLSIAPNANFHLGMYESKTDGSPPKRDGIPYMYDFGEKKAGNGDIDLGTFSLPEPHLVSIRFLYADGEPAPTVQPKIKAKNDGHWFGDSQMRVNRDGYLQLDGADYTGVEIAGPVLFSGEFLETGAKYEKSFNVDESMDIVVQAGKGFCDPASTTTVKSTTSATDESSLQKTSRPTSETTSATSPKTPTTVSNTTRTTERRRRGFLSNDISGEKSDSLLNDPYFFTVGGFGLSVVGILHQLVGGK